MSKQSSIWDKIFIELAQRAIRKVHYDYQRLSSGNTFHHSSISNLNIGKGIEYAFETDVLFAINQEFSDSGYTSGRLVEGDKKKDQPDQRFYRIYREYAYADLKPKTKLNRSFKLDLYIQRYNPLDTNETHDPAIIEAKKVRTITINGEGEEEINCNVSEVVKDVIKLYKYSNGKNCRKYLLLWNWIEKDDRRYEDGQKPTDVQDEILEGMKLKGVISDLIGLKSKRSDSEDYKKAIKKTQNKIESVVAKYYGKGKVSLKSALKELVDEIRPLDNKYKGRVGEIKENIKIKITDVVEMIDLIKTFKINKNNLVVKETRWFPLDWQGRGASNYIPSKSIRWLWVSLFEIEFPKR